MNKELSIVDIFQQENPECNVKQIKDYLGSLKAMGIAKQLNDQQMFYFLKYCYTLNLNPLLKEVHCVTYKNRDGSVSMTPIVSYYQYMRKAQQHPSFQMPELVWVVNDKDGNPLPIDDQYIIGSIQRKGETTKYTKIFVMREWNKRQGEWLTKPKHMLEVRATKNLLAIGYPDELAAYETPMEEMEVNIQQEKPKRNIKGVFESE